MTNPLIERPNVRKVMTDVINTRTMQRWLSSDAQNNAALWTIIQDVVVKIDAAGWLNEEAIERPRPDYADLQRLEHYARNTELHNYGTLYHKLAIEHGEEPLLDAIAAYNRDEKW